MTTRLLLLPARNLARRPRRTAIALAAIAFGIVALLLASGFIEWIYFDMRESTIRAHLGHVQVTRRGYHESGQADPGRFQLPAGGAALRSVAEAPHVERVVPRLSFTGLASLGDETVSFVADGVATDPGNPQARAVRIVEGRALATNDANHALLGLGLARNLGARVGDKVVLLVNKPAGGINAVEATVAGLFSTVSKAYDDHAIRVPIGTARTLLGVPGAHVWLAFLDDTAQTDTVVADLGKRLPAGFDVVPWHALADFYNKTVALFSRQVQVVKVIIAAIIILSITNTMMMAVTERTGEIGTSMALGVRRAGVLVQFVVEGALLGVAGGIAGLILGLVLAAWISHVGIPMPPPPGMAHGFLGQIRITPGMAAESVLLAIVTTLLATLYPAWKASRLPIVDALRHNR